MTRPTSHNGEPMTAASITEMVRSALESADLEQLGALLSPVVHRGAPDDPSPPCRNRSQVLRWSDRVGPRGAGPP